jgi:hypothetical protein
MNLNSLSPTLNNKLPRHHNKAKMPKALLFIILFLAISLSLAFFSSRTTSPRLLHKRLKASRPLRFEAPTMVIY